jgi:hypothetical protein
LFRNTDFEIGKVQGGTTFGHGTQIVWGSLRSLWADGTSALHTAARTLELHTVAGTLEFDTAAGTLEFDTAARTLEFDTAARTLEFDTAARTLEFHTVAGTLELDTASRILELDTAARTHGKYGRITALQKDVWNSNRKSVSPMTCVVRPV